jgi:beta-glucosidase
MGGCSIIEGMSPFPSPAPEDFCWATGIEDTFIPHKRPGMRALDEYELTQHYTQWRTDFDWAAQSGAKVLRWGIPWYRVQPAPNRWEWGWVDEALDDLVHRKGLLPILDLIHYGTPLWLENSFINHSYPQRVAEYAAAVTERYRTLTNYITPINEPTLNAEFCGRRGEWPPYLTGDDGYVKVLMALARGMLLSTQAIRAANPQAVLVQVEALMRHWTKNPTYQQQVELDNEQQYLAIDLTTGRVDQQHPLYPYLREHGVQQGELDWFREHAVHYDVIGANFYPWSYGELVPRTNRAGTAVKLLRRRVKIRGSAIAEVVEDAYRRYGLPVMVTETSAKGDIAIRAQWMDDSIAALFALRRRGVPVVGYTWFPLFSMIDWAYRLGRSPASRYLIHLGLVEADFDQQGILRRRATRLLEQYAAYTRAAVPELPPGSPSASNNAVPKM